jgi:hypothetical protein
MRVRCLGSVNLIFRDFFSELYKFFCHVSQIVSVGSSEALVLGDQPFMYYIQTRWEWSLCLRVEACAKKRFGIKSMLHITTDFLWALPPGTTWSSLGIRVNIATPHEDYFLIYQDIYDQLLPTFMYTLPLTFNQVFWLQSSNVFSWLEWKKSHKNSVSGYNLCTLTCSSSLVPDHYKVSLKLYLDWYTSSEITESPEQPSFHF